MKTYIIVLIILIPVVMFSKEAREEVEFKPNMNIGMGGAMSPLPKGEYITFNFEFFLSKKSSYEGILMFPIGANKDFINTFIYKYNFLRLWDDFKLNLHAGFVYNLLLVNYNLGLGTSYNITAKISINLEYHQFFFAILIPYPSLGLINLKYNF